MVIPALTRTEDAPEGTTSGKALLPALKRSLSFSKRRNSTNSGTASIELNQNNNGGTQLT